MIKTKIFFSVCVRFTLLFLSLPTTAAPWIDVGDEALRHHLQVLADAGVITVPITTYPLMWSGIARDIETISDQPLSDAQMWSLSHVRHEMNRQTNSFVMDTRIGVSSDALLAQGFAADQREKNEIEVAANWLGESISVNLVATAASDEIDDHHYRLDGSYIAGVMGNWSVAVGAINYWWGPGWENSLILSHNARPVPGLTLQRNYSEAFETPWLSWIGPWQLVAFGGQLESSRHVPDAKLIGMRLTIKPLNNLEVGFSRTAQWGGEGRPQSLSSLWDAFIGKDNRGDDGITQDNEPGNQLAGVDARVNFSLGDSQFAFYTQGIGEDAAGIGPSRFIVLAGAEAAWASYRWHNRLYIEGSSTEASQGGNPNYAYEHSIYRSGYRHRSRSLGASLDSDTRHVAVAGDHHLAAGHQLSWKLAAIELNRDGDNPDEPAGNPLSDEALDFYRAELGYKHRMNRKTQLGITGYYQSEDIQWRGRDETLGSGAMLTIEHKW